jgi:hypothetical protein
MFRCVEVFCKRRDGEYSHAGFVILIIVAALLFLFAINTWVSVDQAGSSAVPGLSR